MAISPVGGMIFTNQNMQIPATKQADFQQRLDLQTAVNMAESQEKDKIIEEIRPTEESYKVDADKDDEEQKRHGGQNPKKNPQKKDDDGEEIPEEVGHLDLRI